MIISYQQARQLVNEGKAVFAGLKNTSDCWNYSPDKPSYIIVSRLDVPETDYVDLGGFTKYTTRDEEMCHE